VRERGKEIEEKENYNRWRQKTRVGKRRHRKNPREIENIEGKRPSRVSVK